MANCAVWILVTCAILMLMPSSECLECMQCGDEDLMCGSDGSCPDCPIEECPAKFDRCFYAKYKIKDTDTTKKSGMCSTVDDCKRKKEGLPRASDKYETQCSSNTIHNNGYQVVKNIGLIFSSLVAVVLKIIAY